MPTKRPVLLGLGGLVAVVALVAAACGSTAATTTVESATPTPVPPTAVPSDTSSAMPSDTASVAPSAAATDVTISGFAFSPATLTVPVGTTVTWTNQDAVGHDVVADDSSWTSPMLAQGATYTHLFDKAGTYTYHCGVHPNMKATIVVTG